MLPYSYIIRTHRFSVKHDYIDNSFHIKEIASGRVYVVSEGQIPLNFFSEDLIHSSDEKIDFAVAKIIKLLLFI